MLIPGTLLHDEIFLQHYNDEEADESRVIAEIMQMAFNGLTIDEIRKEYQSEIELLQPYKFSSKNIFATNNSEVKTDPTNTNEMMIKWGISESQVKEFI